MPMDLFVAIGRVLPMAVAGVKEVELVVLGALVPDLTPVDDDPLDSLPGLERKPCFEGLQVVGDPAPALAPLDDGPQTDPVPEGDLDGVLGPRLEPIEQIPAEIGSIEAKFEWHVADGVADLRDDVTDEADSVLTIGDVAGSILHARDVARLGDVGHDRVVAGDFAMVGVVAALCSFDLKPRRADRAIDIDGESLEPKSPDAFGDEIGREILESDAHWAGAAGEPASDGAWCGHDRQSGEAQDDGIPARYCR